MAAVVNVDIIFACMVDPRSATRLRTMLSAPWCHALLCRDSTICYRCVIDIAESPAACNGEVLGSSFYQFSETTGSCV
jgi:hypothetical protein